MEPELDLERLRDQFGLSNQAIDVEATGVDDFENEFEDYEPESGSKLPLAKFALAGGTILAALVGVQYWMGLAQFDFNRQSASPSTGIDAEKPTDAETIAALQAALERYKFEAANQEAERGGEPEFSNGKPPVLPQDAPAARAQPLPTPVAQPPVAALATPIVQRSSPTPEPLPLLVEQPNDSLSYDLPPAFEPAPLPPLAAPEPSAPVAPAVAPQPLPPPSEAVAVEELLSLEPELELASWVEVEEQAPELIEAVLVETVQATDTVVLRAGTRIPITFPEPVIQVEGVDQAVPLQFEIMLPDEAGARKALLIAVPVVEPSGLLRLQDATLWLGEQEILLGDLPTLDASGGPLLLARRNLQPEAPSVGSEVLAVARDGVVETLQAQVQVQTGSELVDDLLGNVIGQVVEEAIPAVKESPQAVSAPTVAVVEAGTPATVVITQTVALELPALETNMTAEVLTASAPPEFSTPVPTPPQVDAVQLAAIQPPSALPVVSEVQPPILAPQAPQWVAVSVELDDVPEQIKETVKFFPPVAPIQAASAQKLLHPQVVLPQSVPPEFSDSVVAVEPDCLLLED